jgi:DNA adenine methylase
MPARLPHPIPYQGSKRRLAGPILRDVRGRVGTLYEPFAGSAAITIAAAARGLADAYVIGDSLHPLVAVWDGVLESPDVLAGDYAALWREQLGADGAAHFNRVRSEFNARPDAARLLYLLARCVKNAPRFGRGGFNQSADHRRRGMRPEKMRREIQGAHALLRGRTRTFAGDAEACVAAATPGDLVYLDPPWQGTTEGADKRYHQGFPRPRLEALLAALNERGVPWILSYDGRVGARTYGAPLPSSLWGAHLSLHAGRSAQSTLSGRAEHTVESVYLSTAREQERGGEEQHAGHPDRGAWAGQGRQAAPERGERRDRRAAADRPRGEGAGDAVRRGVLEPVGGHDRVEHADAEDQAELDRHHQHQPAGPGGDEHQPDRPARTQRARAAHDPARPVAGDDARREP